MTHTPPTADVYQETFTVNYDGSTYEVWCLRGVPTSVATVAKKTTRRGPEKFTVWPRQSESARWRGLPAKPPGEKIAKVISFVKDPVAAAVAGAQVIDPAAQRKLDEIKNAELEAYYARAQAREEAARKAKAERERLADAAPALLAALKAYVHADLEAAGLRPIGGGYLSPALAAIAQAEGNT